MAYVGIWDKQNFHAKIKKKHIPRDSVPAFDFSSIDTMMKEIVAVATKKHDFDTRNETKVTAVLGSFIPTIFHCEKIDKFIR